MITNRAKNHLVSISKKYPNCWRTFDEFRASRGVDLPNWPDWCYAPMAAAYAIVSGGGDNRVAFNQICEVSKLSALAAWRVTQGIYRYDPTFYNEIISTKITGDVPHDVLYRMPEWCVYIETPGMAWADESLFGFFAHLEWDAGSTRHELRLLIDTETNLIPIPIHIGNWSLSESIEKALDLSKVHATALDMTIPGEAKNIILNGIEPLISLLIYLCSENAEIGNGIDKPANPAPKRTKQGWRLFTADKTTEWDVGVRIGAALRSAYQVSETQNNNDSDRSRPRAHVRRAHWHTFLSGEGKKDRKLKWLPPIPINISDIDTMPATIKQAKK